MTLEERLAAVEQELADLRRLRLRDAIKDLQEAATVTGYAQARLERSHQDHAEWLESHNKAMADHAQAMREIDDRIRAIVSAIGELTARIGIPPKPPL